MGFNSVYRSLVEIFPQIDSRILKAVAIEHPKDIDAAAENVLSEVVPFLSTHSIVHSSPLQKQVSKALSDEGAEQNNQLERRVVASLEEESSSVMKETGAEPLSCTASTSGLCNADLACLKKASNDCSDLDGNDAVNQLFEGSANKDLILLGKAQEKNTEIDVNQVLNCVSGDSVREEGNCGDLCQVCDDGNVFDQTPLVATALEQGNVFANCSLSPVSRDKDYDNGMAIIGSGNEAKSSSNTSIREDGNDVYDMPSLYVSEQTPGSPKSYLNSECGSDTSNLEFRRPNDIVSIEKDDIGDELTYNQAESSSNTNIREDENSGFQLLPISVTEQTPGSSESYPCSEFGFVSSNLELEQPNGAISVEKDDTCDEPTLNTIINQSGQSCRVDLLEAIIEDSKDNKKTLFSAMELVMNMMKEVESEEIAAEQAKEEATRGGLDILAKAEELKQMLVHAKEANDMHSGEVYGEKAILATEVKELQTRLLGIAEERDMSLAMLDGMQETLQARLAAAEEVRKAAEQEKMEKEENARKAFAAQEIIMDNVVKESKILQQEAEENSKLREFLMDRGRIVDSLQGEISVICQDVRLLKEKFDNNVPLSQSITSSQTTCLLASSGSSLKSNASDLLHETLTVVENKSPTPSFFGDSPKSLLQMRQPCGDRKDLSDDDWEIFDKDI